MCATWCRLCHAYSCTQLSSRVSPFTVPKMMLNAAGGNLSIRYGLRGVNYSVATACATSR